MLPDVAGIDRPFDYVVPSELDDRVGVGTRVRISLHGRRVGGWVVADRVTPPEGVALRPIARVSGLGPGPDVVELAGWAAWRWAGRTGAFLATASPPRAVHDLPARGRRAGGGPVSGNRGDLEEGVVAEALAQARTVVRLPPASDPFPLVEAAIAGSADGAAALVIVPSQEWAARAPAPDLSAVVVLDAHDEAHGEERAPTWNAWVAAAERAERRGAPCLLVSPCPVLEALAWGRLVTVSRRAERQGWAPLEVVDRRKEDPRSGLFSERLVAVARGAGTGAADRVVCVLNRTGRGRLLACGACGELARCERCEGPLAQTDSPGRPPGPAVATDVLRCRRCGEERPDVCAACGARR